MINPKLKWIKLLQTNSVDYPEDTLKIFLALGAKKLKGFLMSF